MASKPFQFVVGQKFEGAFTGAIREITEVRRYTVDFTITYRDGRKSEIWGSSKRLQREMIAAGDIKLVA